MAVRIISTQLLRLFKRLALRLWVPCQGLAVSTGSNLTGKCVIIAIVEGRDRRAREEKKNEGEEVWREKKHKIRSRGAWINGGINGQTQWRKKEVFRVGRPGRAGLVKTPENVANL